MKVKALINLGRGLPKLAEGQVAEVDRETAEALIRRGLVESVEAKSKSKAKPKTEKIEKIEATPPEPIKGVDDNETVKVAEGQVAEIKESARGKSK